MDPALEILARHVKNVPGRKSDVSDCQWIQRLHTVGLLRGSFRPTAEITAIRTLLRRGGAPSGTAAAAAQHAGGDLDGAVRTHHRGLQDALRFVGAGLTRMQQHIEKTRDWNGPDR